MYKVKYLATGNVFVIPEETAKELKKNYPDEYLIIEKNGKKFKDRIKAKTLNVEPRSIKSMVLEG